MQFRILGPVEAIDQDRTLSLGGGRQLALFAILLLHANEVLSTDRLVDELWSGEPPATAEKIVRNYVSLLRKQLGDRLVRRAPGYLLRVEPGELDSERFETLVREAREQPPAAATASLRQALALWDGQPLAQLAYEPFAQRAIAGLEDRRLEALEDLIDADLHLGREREVVPELERLVREHPLRERPRSLLMLALYRAGRQADALDVYRDARRALVDELGLEPGPALQELQRRILAHDPDLAGPPRQSGAAARRRRGGLLIAAGGVVLLVAGIAVGVVELTASSNAARLSQVAPNSVGVIDPNTNRIVGQVPIDSAPTAVTFGDGAIWTANSSDHTVTRFDPNTRSVVKTIAVPGAPSGLVVAGRDLWVLLLYSPDVSEDAYVQDAGIAQIDTSVNDVLGSFRLAATVWGYFDTIAAGARFLWAADNGVVSRVDAVRGRVTKRVDVETGSASRLAVGAGAVWALAGSAVERINPASASIVASIPIAGGTGPTPNALAVGRGAVWVANIVVPPPRDVLGHELFRRAVPGTVSRIDPRTNAVAATIAVGRYSDAIAVGAGAVWVANRDDGTLSRIDPKTNSVVATIHVGGRPEGVAVGAGAVWVTVG
jgi:YVTN family beta-propeller protein